MKAVILAGGMGTRLREETEFRPKPMVEIGGRPILWHIMKTLSAQGINDFVICLGYKGDYIKDFFMKIKFIVFFHNTYIIVFKMFSKNGLKSLFLGQIDLFKNLYYLKLNFKKEYGNPFQK